MSKSGPKCWIYRFLQKPKENPKGHFEFCYRRQTNLLKTNYFIQVTLIII